MVIKGQGKEFTIKDKDFTNFYPFATHRRVELTKGGQLRFSKTDWAVTHIPTGLAITDSLDSQERANMLAVNLATLPSFMLAESKDDISASDLAEAKHLVNTTLARMFEQSRIRNMRNYYK